jgi:hypothetical protein
MTQDDENDPAFAPLREAGQGESEGFEESEDLLVEHASHGDQHGTTPITHDAAGFDDPETASIEYGEADEEQPEDA